MLLNAAQRCHVAFTQLWSNDILLLTTDPCFSFKSYWLNVTKPRLQQEREAKAKVEESERDMRLEELWVTRREHRELYNEVETLEQLHDEHVKLSSCQTKLIDRLTNRIRELERAAATPPCSTGKR